METTFYISFAIALLAVLDPLGNIPVFLSCTSDIDAKRRRRTAYLLSVVIFFGLILFLFFGESVLKFFGITLPAFQIAGGIILLLIGIEMLRGSTYSTQKKYIDVSEAKVIQESKSGISRVIVPVGIPLFVGPGSISTVILYSAQANDFSILLMLALTTAIVCSICLVLLLASANLEKLLTKTGLDIATRILGIIIASIAVQFMLDGLSKSALFTAS